MANINVRAKDNTILKLKAITEKTNFSQGDVVEKALFLYDDLLLLKKEASKKEKNEDILNLFIKLILNRL